MKTCPVCQAIAFDDAQTCFGCLHQYDDEGQGESPRIPGESAHGCASTSGVGEDANRTLPPAFVVKVVPVREEAGGVSWTCSVDFVNS